VRATSTAVAACLVVSALSEAAAKPEPTPLEWLLKADKTRTHVRPRAKAKVWLVDRRKPLAGISIDRDQTFARLRDAGKARVRVVIEGQSVEVAAFVAIADLWQVATRPALVHPDRRIALRATTPETPGVHLDPGAPVTVVRRSKSAKKIGVDHGVISASGFVASTAVGIDFAPTPAAKVQAADFRVGATALRDRPGGPIVARLSPAKDEQHVAVRRLAVSKNHALVAYDGLWATAVGWIPVAELEPGGRGGFGFGSGSGGSSRIRLLRGTVLRDSKAGTVVGVVTRTSSFRKVSSDGNWKLIEAPTEVGDLRLWASDERMALSDD